MGATVREMKGFRSGGTYVREGGGRRHVESRDLVGGRASGLDR
jgi:hypothetical protein